MTATSQPKVDRPDNSKLGTHAYPGHHNRICLSPLSSKPLRETSLVGCILRVEYAVGSLHVCVHACVRVCKSWVDACIHSRLKECMTVTVNDTIPRDTETLSESISLQQVCTFNMLVPLLTMQNDVCGSPVTCAVKSTTHCTRPRCLHRHQHIDSLSNESPLCPSLN